MGIVQRIERAAEKDLPGQAPARGLGAFRGAQEPVEVPARDPRDQRARFVPVLQAIACPERQGQLLVPRARRRPTRARREGQRDTLPAPAYALPCRGADHSSTSPTHRRARGGSGDLRMTLATGGNRRRPAEPGQPLPRPGQSVGPSQGGARERPRNVRVHVLPGRNPERLRQRGRGVTVARFQHCARRPGPPMQPRERLRPGTGELDHHLPLRSMDDVDDARQLRVQSRFLLLPAPLSRLRRLD